MSLEEQLVALERAIVAGKDETAAAANLREAVMGGASTEGVIARLVAALDATLVPEVRSSLASAVTIDLIRRGDIAGWLALRTRRRTVVLDVALVGADEDGIVVPAAMLALPEPANINSAVPAIVRWWRRDREARTDHVVAACGLEELLTFARWMNLDNESLAPFVARIGEALSHFRDSQVRAQAAGLLRRAAQQGCALGGVLDALREALDDAAYHDDNPANDAAYALARAGESGLDRDPRAAVRRGAWSARPSFLGLLDPEPHNRRVIAAALLEQIANDPASCPTNDETQCLLAELLDPVVAEVVYAVIDRGEVATLIAGIEPRGAARHLVAAARAVLAHEPPPVCRSCRDIPRHASGRNFKPPPAAEHALMNLDVESEGERRYYCRGCGAEYRVSSSDASDMYPAYHASLERRPWDDPDQVARWREWLDHPEPWVRRDAAWIVAGAAVRAEDTATLDELAGHVHVDVRREAWRVMPATAMSRGLDDPDDEIRSLAAYHLAAREDVAVVVDLLGRDPVIAQRAASHVTWDSKKPIDERIVQAARSRMLAARHDRAPDYALSSICYLLGRALASTPNSTIIAEAIEIAIGARPAIQDCMLNLLTDCGPDADTSALDDTLAQLLRHPETRREALTLLEMRATARRPLRVDHLHALAASLDASYSRENEIAAAVFAHAVRTPATRAAGVAGLLALLDVETNDYTAAGKLHELAREVSLGDDAISYLIERAGIASQNYVRALLLQAVLADAERRGDPTLVNTLREHPHPGVAGAMRFVSPAS